MLGARGRPPGPRAGLSPPLLWVDPVTVISFGLASGPQGLQGEMRCVTFPPGPTFSSCAVRPRIFCVEPGLALPRPWLAFGLWGGKSPSARTRSTFALLQHAIYSASIVLMEPWGEPLGYFNWPDAKALGLIAVFANSPSPSHPVSAPNRA